VASPLAVLAEVFFVVFPPFDFEAASEDGSEHALNPTSAALANTAKGVNRIGCAKGDFFRPGTPKTLAAEYPANGREPDHCV
jgi:hypothetical protein